MANVYLLEKRLRSLFGDRIIGVEIKGDEDTGDIIIYTDGKIPDPPKKVLDQRVFVIDRSEPSPRGLGYISRLELPREFIPRRTQVKRKGRRATMARRRHLTRPDALERPKNRARWLLSNPRKRTERTTMGQLPGREKAKYMVNDYTRDSRYWRPRRRVPLYKEQQKADRARILTANQFREDKVGVGEGDFRRNPRTLDREDYITTRTEPWEVWSRPFTTEIEPEGGGQDPRGGRRRLK